MSDEGIRLYFDDAKLNPLTIRPSGNALHFHIQLHTFPTQENLIAEKERLRKQGQAIMDHLCEQLEAPRE